MLRSSSTAGEQTKQALHVAEDDYDLFGHVIIFNFHISSDYDESYSLESCQPGIVRVCL